MVDVTLGWSMPSDLLDVVAFGPPPPPEHNFISYEHVVFFNNCATPDGTIRLTSGERTIQVETDEEVDLWLILERSAKSDLGSVLGIHAMVEGHRYEPPASLHGYTAVLVGSVATRRFEPKWTGFTADFEAIVGQYI
ncbi:hypothetical protein WSK_3146 [Novosphingobium sp. Rr 2-17]|uniref:hypothetical protein n=1 Tax=Novosphingobium sp. Rr 2-17 TaxID=555793 RepID=UPI0002698237|nr:hypothetical protein [Novosphingobium sp. Rr 2-17]EIZ78264.1 hypothetical protein WSK_3146 [Novosphingobium sp. Rr 2-17]